MQPNIIVGWAGGIWLVGHSHMNQTMMFALYSIVKGACCRRIESAFRTIIGGSLLLHSASNHGAESFCL